MIIKPLYTAPAGSIIDTHAHYDDRKFDTIRDELLSGLDELGVGKVINCGCNEFSSAKCIELAKKYPVCYAAVGCHPSDANQSINLSAIKNMLKEEKVVAVGEIGLDYYWEKENKEVQKKIFCKQIELALDHDLPIIVHDREAHSDTMSILREYRPKGVMHCFSGSLEMAMEIVKLGMYVGIGGVLTFKNAKKLLEVAQNIPLDRILLETDAPYLAPEPFRSKLNNSSLIIYVAEKLSLLKGVSTEEVICITSENAKNLFKF